MNKLYLSKTKYCTGMQCPKILWYDRLTEDGFRRLKIPVCKDERDDTYAKAGIAVGDAAKGYFGKYEEVLFDRSDYAGMCIKTRELIDAGTAVIAEATFTYDGNFCMVDILHKTGGGYEIIEVKSAVDNSGGDVKTVGEIYLNDMAYQYFIVTNCGSKVKKVSLMRLNGKYTRKGALDIKSLFTLTDCTETVLTMQKDIPGNIAEIRAVATQKDEPAEQIGSRCRDCMYKEACFRALPVPNVFDIGFRLSGAKKDKAYRNGHVSFPQVLGSAAAKTLNEKQLRQVETEVNNLPPHADVKNLRKFLKTLKYPIYHLDFETFQQPIPLWDGVRPYQQIPFQYSLHIQGKPGGEPVHKEFLAKEGEDPRRVLAERLCADIPAGACVLVYYKPFEQGRIEELAVLFPDLSKRLLDICKNIKDLMVPFRNGHYYCREMQGSCSLKYVLPALCGGDPELDYKELDLIHNGSDAMTIYATLHEQPPETIERVRAALLAYCKLDTLAMVKVLGKLYEAAVGGSTHNEQGC